MYGCTVAEAGRLGRYLACTLQRLKRWKEDQEAFDQEVGKHHVSYPQFNKLVVIWEVALCNVCPSPLLIPTLLFCPSDPSSDVRQFPQQQKFYESPQYSKRVGCHY
jgi:hypothetical protein